MAPTQRAAMWMRSSTNHMFCSSAPRPIISSPPEHGVGRHLDVEQDRRVAVRVVVRERRVLEERDAGDVAVDQEQRRQAVVAVDDVDHDDVVVGHVAGGDEPLLGLDPEAAVRAHGRAGDAAGVGAGVALGDRVRVGALAAQARLQVALDLLRRAEAEHVVGARPAPPDGVRVAAELLVHDHLLDHRTSRRRRGSSGGRRRPCPSARGVRGSRASRRRHERRAARPSARAGCSTSST